MWTCTLQFGLTVRTVHYLERVRLPRASERRTATNSERDLEGFAQVATGLPLSAVALLRVPTGCQTLAKGVFARLAVGPSQLDLLSTLRLFRPRPHVGSPCARTDSMDSPPVSPAGSRAPSSTPATPLQDESELQAQAHPGSVSGDSVDLAGIANEVQGAGDRAPETHEGDPRTFRLSTSQDERMLTMGSQRALLPAETTQKDASGHDASQQQEGPAPKRIKKEFGGEKWTREEELALLEIRKGQGGATWEGTPEKLVAKGFAKRSVTALKQRWQAMDGASGSAFASDSSRLT